MSNKTPFLIIILHKKCKNIYNIASCEKKFTAVHVCEFPMQKMFICQKNFFVTVASLNNSKARSHKKLRRRLLCSSKYIVEERDLFYFVQMT